MKKENPPGVGGENIVVSLKNRGVHILKLQCAVYWTLFNALTPAGQYPDCGGFGANIIFGPISRKAIYGKSSQKRKEKKGTLYFTTVATTDAVIFWAIGLKM